MDDAAGAGMPAKIVLGYDSQRPSGCLATEVPLARDKIDELIRREMASHTNKCMYLANVSDVLLEQIPKEFRFMVRFFNTACFVTEDRKRAAYLVPPATPHLIIRNEARIAAYFGIILGDSRSPATAGLTWQLRERNLLEAMRVSESHLVYAWVPAVPLSIGNGPSSALARYSVFSFFPLYGEPGAQARPGLEKALANPVETLEERMGAMGYRVVNLEAVGR
ncbi:hypothetical protein HYV85_01770 [Candidatus Woesearchaeota archaeon]|nr:hypothetical protein [Candidatus Woesearchaeota archaeon]